MTSAVGPADVSVDRSTVNGQGGCGQRAPPVSLSTRLTGGPLGSDRKRKRKGVLVWLGFGPKEAMGRLEAHRLGSGTQGQLGLRLSRPARANGLATRAAG
jgi:hypothetical protein